MGIRRIMWQVLMADGEVPPWGFEKERPMSSLCSERLSMNRNGERDLMRFSDVDMTMYSRTEKSGRRRSEEGAALPDRVETTSGVLLYIAKLAPDAHSHIGRKTSEQGENQYGKPFYSTKERVNSVFETNRNVVESYDFQDEFVTRFNIDLAQLAEPVRTKALRLELRGNTWLTAEEAGALPVPEFQATRAWLGVTPP